MIFISKNDLISIIIPIYNVEKYIHKCLDSICNQTYQNIEIILVEDGSPDNCGKICDEYAQKDKRIIVIHKENGGLSSARNAGLDIAKGEYISFIDSDDFIALDFIEKLYLLCINNNVDIAECNFLRFENDILKDKTISDIEIYTPLEMQNRIYSDFNMRTIIVWNKLYKRYIYENMRFPIGKINEDEFCTYKAFYNCKSKIAVTNEKLYFYRYSPNSIMGKNFNLKRLDILEAYEERKEFYKNNKEVELYIKTLKSYSYTLEIIYELVRINIENPEIYLHQIYNKAKENYLEIKKYKGEVYRLKLRNLIFIYCPFIYKIIKNIFKKARRKTF